MKLSRRLIGIDLRRGAANRGNEARRIAVGAKHKDHRRAIVPIWTEPAHGLLAVRHIHDRRLILREAIDDGVADHSYNLTGLFVGDEVEGDAFSDGIFVGEEAADEG